MREFRPVAKPCILVEDYAGVTVATLTNSAILDAAMIDEIARQLYALVDEQNKQKLVLDFSNVRFLSSQTLGVLLNLNKKMAAIKGELVLCALRKELMKVFEIAKLAKMFRFFENDAAALASFDVHVK